MFLRAVCLVGGNSQREATGLLGTEDSTKRRGVQCLFRHEQRVSGFTDSLDVPCKQTTMDNISVLSTEDVATDGGFTSVDNLSIVDPLGPSESNGFVLGTLPALAEVSVLATQTTTSFPEGLEEEDARALAKRTMAHFKGRMQRRDVRQEDENEETMRLGSAPMPPLEFAQPLLAQQRKLRSML